MRYRRLGKSGYKVSEVGFGASAMRERAGQTNDVQAMEILHAAADAGVNFFETADADGGGRTERLMARFRSERDDEIVVAIRVGHRPAGRVDSYDAEQLASWIDRSCENLGTQRLDLLQLHCPPTALYYRPETFAVLDEFVAAGRIASWGVSVRRVEEGLKAVDYPGCASVQVIFNAFRQRPAERLLAAAWEADTGVIARVPLASGLLTDRYGADSTLPQGDHPNVDTQAALLEGGETFAGVPFEVGVHAAERLRGHVPENATLAQFAIRWILMQQAVSTVIVGARNADQARENATASLLAPLEEAVMEAVRLVYDDDIAPHVHHRW